MIHPEVAIQTWTGYGNLFCWKFIPGNSLISRYKRIWRKKCCQGLTYWENWLNWGDLSAGTKGNRSRVTSDLAIATAVGFQINRDSARETVCSVLGRDRSITAEIKHQRQWGFAGNRKGQQFSPFPMVSFGLLPWGLTA
jgi:hypothetical protein